MVKWHRTTYVYCTKVKFLVLKLYYYVWGNHWQKLGEWYMGYIGVYHMRSEIDHWSDIICFLWILDGSFFNYSYKVSLTLNFLNIFKAGLRSLHQYIDLKNQLFFSFLKIRMIFTFLISYKTSPFCPTNSIMAVFSNIVKPWTMQGLRALIPSLHSQKST